MKRKTYKALTVTLALVFILCACGAEPADTATPAVSESTEISDDFETTELDNRKTSGSLSSMFGGESSEDGFTLLPEHANLDDAPNIMHGDSALEGFTADDEVYFELPAYRAGLYEIVVSCSNPYGVDDAFIYLQYENGVIGNLISQGDDFTYLNVGEINLGMGMDKIMIYAKSDTGAEGSLMDLESIEFVLLEADETAVDYAPRGPMTPERAEEIYAYMQDMEFERYWGEFREDWLEYSSEEQEALLQSAMDFAAEMGIRYTNDMDAALENADWYFNTAETSNCLWAVICDSVGIDSGDLSYCNSVYFYCKGLNEGNYEPMHPDIMAVAGSLTTQQYEDTQQYCTGTDSTISLIDRTTEDGSFMQTGSVEPVDAEGLDGFVDYYIYMSEFKYTEAQFGDTDILPALQAIGAMDADGTSAGLPVQICAINTFNAKRLFLLFNPEGEVGTGGITNITTITFDEAAEQYVWDETAYTTTEMACFNSDSDFCYLDEDGELQVVAGDGND